MYTKEAPVLNKTKSTGIVQRSMNFEYNEQFGDNTQQIFNGHLPTEKRPKGKYISFYNLICKFCFYI